MDFDSNFRQLGSYDISALSTWIDMLPNYVWLDTVAKRFAVHAKGRGLFFKNDIRSEHLYGTYHPAYKECYEILEPLLKEIESVLPEEGYWIRLQLARLPAGSEIEPHVDWGWSLRHGHRLHLPIFTNQKVQFSVGGETVHMQPGELWEINNCRQHTVKNDGCSPRIHLILDWAIPIQSPVERLNYLFHLPDNVLFLRTKLDPDEISLYNYSERLSNESNFVCKDSIVSFHYQLKIGGHTILASRADEHVNYLHGYQQLIPGLENALDGLRVGENTIIEIPPSLGYGKRHQDLVWKVDNKLLNSFQRYGNFMLLDKTLLIIRECSSNYIVVDANHLFAGLPLSIEAEVFGIRQPNKQEQRFAVYNGHYLLQNKSLIENLVNNSETAIENQYN